MKQALLLTALLLGTMLGANSADAQVSHQFLSFSIYGQYSTNEFSTNAADGGVTRYQVIKTNAITTATVLQDIAIDLFGADYTNWTSAALLRETDADGHEGIFLYKPNPETNVNVSSFFSMSYAGNFSSQAAANFVPILNTNGITDVTSLPDYYEIVPTPSSTWADLTNFSFNVVNPVLAGYFRKEKFGNVTGIITNYTTYAPSQVSLCYVQLNTANLQFSLLGSGATIATNIYGRVAGVPTLISNLVQTLSFNFGIGTFRANLGTNLLDPNPADFVSGPAHINLAFGTSTPTFSPDPATEVFP